MNKNIIDSYFYSLVRVIDVIYQEEDIGDTLNFICSLSAELTAAKGSTIHVTTATATNNHQQTKATSTNNNRHQRQRHRDVDGHQRSRSIPAPIGTGRRRGHG